MIYFSRLSLYLVLILLLNYSSIAQEKASADSSIDYVDALQYFFSLKNNGEYLDVASEIVFDKDVATYKLKKGKLYTCTSYKGIPYALLFIGDGEFLFTPLSDIEKKQFLF